MENVLKPLKTVVFTVPRESRLHECLEYYYSVQLRKDRTTFFCKRKEKYFKLVSHTDWVGKIVSRRIRLMLREHFDSKDIHRFEWTVKLVGSTNIAAVLSRLNQQYQIIVRVKDEENT